MKTSENALDLLPLGQTQCLRPLIKANLLLLFFILTLHREIVKYKVFKSLLELS